MLSEISVVLPVGLNYGLLSQQLLALERQTYSGSKRLIVSCNGGNLKEIERILGNCISSVWSTEIVDSSQRIGPSFARNCGWKVADTNLVLFCDADDVVDDLWVSQMVYALSRYSLVGGSLEMEQLNPTHLAKTFSVPGSLPSKWGKDFGPSCNLGVRVGLLKQLGGFDEVMFTSEDIDFCWRAAQVGSPIHFAPEAIVHYRLRSDPLSLYRQGRGYGIGDKTLRAKHQVAAKRGETTRELLSALKLTVQSPFSIRAFHKAAYRWGYLSGLAANQPSTRPRS